ncbi:protein LTV1 homolog [Watersipora subatra]|uniref:protein LTV1 homolog n=1 Tax=Watersipora subatra TaxID=2589382 RepID=UPI00355B27CD
MPRRKKKFIDKKNAITYHLIHRSQKDPLQADADAPQRVLVTSDELSAAKRKEELATHGIYYDDDYDYTQHLKDVKDLNMVEPDRDIELFRVGTTASKPLLPPEVLPSEKEEKIGLLELAAPVSGPRLDWDPDIVAALDSDNDEPMDSDLEDDFIALANESDEEGGPFGGSELPDRQAKWIEEQYLGQGDIPALPGGICMSKDDTAELSSNFDDEDELGSLQDFSDEETKTRFTNYSMSSSIMRRNEGLTLIDDKFEQMFAEYADEEIGALDDEDIDGKVSTTGPLMEHLLEQFEKAQMKKDFGGPADSRVDIEVCSDADSSEEEMCKVVIDEGCTNRWDCETILSTYSNLYNHPTVIACPSASNKPKKIELTKKLGIPVESVASSGLTKQQLKLLDKQNGAKFKEHSENLVRSKDETTEEKRQRKALVKEERKERRAEKKNTKVAFRKEATVQRKQQMNMAANQQGHKIM